MRSRSVLSRLLCGAAALAVVGGLISAAPAAAQDPADPLPLCRDVPARVWGPGAPNVPFEAEQKISGLANRYTGVFAGTAYAVDHNTIEIFYKESKKTDAERLVADLGSHARYADLVAKPYNYVELESMNRDVMSASLSIDGLEPRGWNPDIIRGGVKVEVRSQPTAEVRQLAFDTLVPLGMVFMCVEESEIVLLPGTAEDLYVTEGTHYRNGRLWRTACEPYSQVERCRTEIQASVVRQQSGNFTVVNDWAFNSLTYTAGPRSLWEGNPLAQDGTWRAADGRTWRTECGTPVTGRDACRSYVTASVIATTPRGYEWRTVEVFNNQVRFG